MVISSTSNEWPQMDETGLMASSGRIMEKPRQLEQPLKCPRCDSSNTKFCYYNNYSLSQPRHFCKACKRYWTRGGMLRNVPVGGGCKKNKRIKRTASSADAPPPSLPTTSTLTPTTSQIDLSSVSNLVSPLYYGLPDSPSDINLAFPRFQSRVSNMETAPMSCTGYDLQPQLNTLGLGFSLVTMNGNDVHNDEYGAGFNPSSAQIHDVVSSNSLLSNYSLFGSTSSTSTCPTTASLITSGLREQNLIRNGLKETQPTNHFQALLPFEDLKIAGNHDPGTFIKELKVEEGRNLGVPSQNPMEPIRSSDPPLYWNTTTVGSWPDLIYFGSSVTPLI